VCGEGNGVDKCSSPHVGFHFNPLTDLQLEKTALSGSFPAGFLSALSAYKSVSGFLPGAYIVAAILMLLAPIIAGFASGRPIIGAISSAASFIASILLLAASITLPVVFSKLNSSINDTFSSAGISSTFGSKPIIVSFFATLLSLAAAIVIAIRTKSSYPSKYKLAGKNASGPRELKLATKGIQPTRGPSTASRKTPFSAVLQRIPTFGQARYTQIEKQPQVVAVGQRRSIDEDRQVLFEADGIRGEVIHEHDHEEEEEPQGYIHEGPRGIQMQPMGRGGARDINVAYEPYSHGA
jgi:hypothetical protein